MIHINVSKNKQGQKQFRVVEVSDKNGKVIGAETKLNSKPAAWKNIVAKLNLYSAVCVNVQDNTAATPVVYLLAWDGKKIRGARIPQTIKK